MAIKNSNRVPLKQWRKWSAKARQVFNDLYDFAMANPRLLLHPNQEKPKAHFWKVTAWNVSWIAADAVDNAMPDAVEDMRAGKVVKVTSVKTKKGSKARVR